MVEQRCLLFEHVGKLFEQLFREQQQIVKIDGAGAIFIILLSIAFTACDINQTEPVPLSMQADTLNESWAVEWWLPRHEQKLIDKTKQDVDLIFMGDSITHGWEAEGQMVWQALYDERNGFNLGFGGDRTENVLWRIQNGAIDGISPKLTVMMIGTNNAGHRDEHAGDPKRSDSRFANRLVV